MSTAAGRVLENRLLPKLQSIYGNQLALSTKNTKSNDFTAPIPIEAKRRKRWDMQAWVRKIKTVANDHQWVIFTSPKNLITDRDIGAVMTVSEEFGLELLKCYEEAQLLALMRERSQADLSRVDL